MDKIKQFLLKRYYNKWKEENKELLDELEEKIDEAVFFGRTLKVNKETGEIEVL